MENVNQQIGSIKKIVEGKLGNDKNKNKSNIIIAILVIAVLILGGISYTICAGGSPTGTVKNVMNDMEDGNITSMITNIEVNGNVVTKIQLEQKLSNAQGNQQTISTISNFAKNIFKNLNYNIVNSQVNENTATVTVNFNWYSIGTINNFISYANTATANENSNDGEQDFKVISDLAESYITNNKGNLSNQSYTVTFDLSKINGKWYINIDDSLKSQLTAMFSQVNFNNSENSEDNENNNYGYND